LEAQGVSPFNTLKGRRTKQLSSRRSNREAAADDAIGGQLAEARSSGKESPKPMSGLGAPAL
jgi:hypothetical protein